MVTKVIVTQNFHPFVCKVNEIQLNISVKWNYNRRFSQLQYYTTLLMRKKCYIILPFNLVKQNYVKGSQTLQTNKRAIKENIFPPTFLMLNNLQVKINKITSRNSPTSKITHSISFSIPNPMLHFIIH